MGSGEACRKRPAQSAKGQGVEIHVTEGGNHAKGRSGNRSEMVPRQNEVNEMTARAIIRKLEGS